MHYRHLSMGTTAFLTNNIENHVVPKCRIANCDDNITSYLLGFDLNSVIGNKEKMLNDMSMADVLEKTGNS
jgi:hypothetical protein